MKNDSSTVYLFDVDGVLTDPVEKRVTEQELFSLLITILQRGDVVAINTGRSLSWVTERVITPLLEKIDHKELFSDVIVVGEKGGAWVSFDKEGNVIQETDQDFVVPHELQEKIKRLVEDKYQESMFFDNTKETMISVEMHDRFAVSEFHSLQKELVEEIESILSETGLAQKYKIDPSTISTDIEEHHAGKALGVDRFLTILEEKGIDPQNFVTFGDSASDLAMADALEQKGKTVTFVYTGDKERLGEIQRSYPIVFSKGYSRGTLEYLKFHLSEMDESHN